MSECWLSIGIILKQDGSVRPPGFLLQLKKEQQSTMEKTSLGIIDHYPDPWVPSPHRGTLR
jgi:hypothetical protein